MKATSSSVSISLQAMPRPRPSTPRSFGTSSSPLLCRRPSCSATPPATRCPLRTTKPKWCTSPWVSCPDPRPQASTISCSTGEQAASLLQPWPSIHTQVWWPLLKLYLTTDGLLIEVITKYTKAAVYTIIFLNETLLLLKCVPLLQRLSWVFKNNMLQSRWPAEGACGLPQICYITAVFALVIFSLLGLVCPPDWDSFLLKWASIGIWRNNHCWSHCKYSIYVLLNIWGCRSLTLVFSMNSPDIQIETTSTIHMFSSLFFSIV